MKHSIFLNSYSPGKNNKNKTPIPKLKSLITSTPKTFNKNKQPKFRRTFTGNFKYNDNLEKKIYLQNINIKTRRSTELLSKLSNTFKACSQYNTKDIKIESNLYSIGARESYLLSQKINDVKNMLSNFDNHFSDIHNQSREKNYNKKESDDALQKIEEIPDDYKDNDIDESSINNNLDFSIDSFSPKKANISNENLFWISSNKSIKTTSKNNKAKELVLSFGDDDTLNGDDSKSKKKNRTKSVIKRWNSDVKILFNSRKMMKDQLKKYAKEIKKNDKLEKLNDAIKYYELVYNYKYLPNDNQLLSFSRKEKLRKSLSAIGFHQNTQDKKLFSDYHSKNQKIYLFLLKNIRKKHKLNNSNNNLNNNKNDFNNGNSSRSKNHSSTQKISQMSKTGPSSETTQRISSSKSSRTSLFSRNKKLKIKTDDDNNNNLNNSSTCISSLNSKIFNLYNNDAINNPFNIKNESYFPDSNRNSKFNKTENKLFNLSNVILSKGEEINNNLKINYKSILKRIIYEIKNSHKTLKPKGKKKITDVKNIRKELNLKERTGKGIDIQELIFKNVDKYKKYMPKSQVQLIRNIAEIVIDEDRKALRPLFYDDTHDNLLFKERIKKEFKEALIESKKIRESLHKEKVDGSFSDDMKKLLKNDSFSFCNYNALKDMVKKIRAIKGEVTKVE